MRAASAASRTVGVFAGGILPAAVRSCRFRRILMKTSGEARSGFPARNAWPPPATGSASLETRTSQLAFRRSGGMPRPLERRESPCNARGMQGFVTNPVLIDEEDGIIAGHGRVLAAHVLGLDEVPCIVLAHLTPAQRRAYVLADNKLALNAGWDLEML